VLFVECTLTHYQELLLSGQYNKINKIKYTAEKKNQRQTQRKMEKAIKSRGMTFDSAPRAAVDKTRWRALSVTPSTSQRRGK
jgi:hypothetical protein